MTRRRLLVALVCLSLVFAGCSSVGGPMDDGRATDDGDGGGAATDVSTGDAGHDGSDGASDEGSVVVWERFAFTEGEFYRFRVDDRSNDRNVLLTWDVVDVDGSEITANVTYDDGNRSYEFSVTGENATIVSQVIQGALRENPNDDAAMEAAANTNAYLSLGPFNVFTSYFATRELAVGNSWKLAGSERDGYMTANVEGKREYAGRTCYVSTIHVPDSEAWTDSRMHDWESCIAPDIGLSLYTAYYDEETGELAAEIVLETYRPGN